MFSAFERMVAWRYLRPRKAEGFISVIAGFSFLGIMLGVATLIIVMSVMNGFRAELFSRILGLNGHLNVVSYGGPLINYDAWADKLRGIDGVVSAAPMIEGQALFSSQGSGTGVIIRGFKKEDLAQHDIFGKAETYVAGSLDEFGDAGVLMGRRLAERFGLRLGERFTLVSPQMGSSPLGRRVRHKTFTIVGLTEVGMFEYDNNFVFMPLETAQTFFSMPDGVSMVEAKVKDPHNVRKMQKEVQEILGPGVRLRSWQDLNASFVSALQVERNVMFLILTLIIVVAAFNVISGMVMLVKDKTAAIAILRTIGARRSSVLKIFLLTGGSIGVLGTLGGLGLGVAFVTYIEPLQRALENLTGSNLFPAEIYFLSQVPAQMDVGEVVQVVGMALFLSIAAAIYPALKAARLDPVEALRYE